MPMDYSKWKTNRIATAAAGLESWLESIRTEQGYGGAAIGFREACVAYCGPGYDWRYEGLLDGFREMHHATGDPFCLDAIERDLRQIQSAQLLNGVFRNSFFEYNPMEGGMPHEPAMLAAACRAARYLSQMGRKCPPGLEAALERYITHYLLKELWNKRLQTFNDWPTSEFQHFSPASVAAAAELLFEYADWSGAWEKIEYYVIGAARSLLDVQIKNNALAGGIPPSSRDADNVNPFLAARCLPALARVAAKTNDGAYKEAALALAAFLRRHRTDTGEFPRMVFAHRPPAAWPAFTGAAAGTLVSMDRAGLIEKQDLELSLESVLRRQERSGAFRTAAGFGKWRTPAGAPDWRDVMPCCGWHDKIYALLARLHPAERAPFAPAEVEHEVYIGNRRGKYVENNGIIRIESGKGEPVFLWEKRQKWPSVCLL